MGWIEKDGLLWGDVAQDAMDQSVDEAVRIAGAEATLERLLAACLDAMALDGADEPFLRDKGAARALAVSADGIALSVAVGAGRPAEVAALYDGLDEVAVAHLDEWRRPPKAREIIGYLSGAVGGHLERGSVALPAGLQAHDADSVVKLLARAQVTFEGSKPPTRGERPPRAEGDAGPRVRVTHAKFGAGTLQRSLDGGKLVVLFDDGVERTLLDRFVVVREAATQRGVGD